MRKKLNQQLPIPSLKTPNNSASSNVISKNTETNVCIWELGYLLDEHDQKYTSHDLINT